VPNPMSMSSPSPSPFQGFLADRRTRPLGLRLLGYGTSLALHGPPLTLFAIAWLTQALVLDHALDLPDYGRKRLVYYEVPAVLVNGVPGDGRGARAGAAPRGGDLAGPRGKAGGGKRRTRRPLALPRVARVRKAPPPPMQVAAIGPHEDVVGEEGDALLHGGRGRTEGFDGDGPGTGDDGGGTGGGLVGPGTGRGGPVGRGTGIGTGAGGGTIDERLANWVPPDLRKQDGRSRGKARNEGPDEEDGGADDEAMVGPPLPDAPPRVSMNYAAYLRTYEPFPTLPESCWPPGRTTNTVLLEICVSDRGEVTNVVVRESAGEEVDGYLTEAARTWRYRPRIVRGTPMPFCHPIRLVYTRALRFDRRW
jgi:hypothetical protein